MAKRPRGSRRACPRERRSPVWAGASPRCVRAATLLGAVVLAVAGCGGPSARLPFDLPVYGAEALQPRELRFRREVGPPDRYQVQYTARVRNDYQQDETVSAQVFYYCPGKNPGPPPHDRVIIWKDEEKREFLEVMPNRTVKRRKNTSDGQPVITPNFEAEPGAKGLRYVPFDELGRILRRKETPFHFAWYDSLCYVWPVLPEKPAKPGDRWTYDLPVIVGKQFTNNLMSLHADFHFSELRRLKGRGAAPGPLVAVIKYSYYAVLDTGDPMDAAKLPPNTPGILWRRNTIEGQGTSYLDIEKGKVVWKSERYTITVERETVAVTRKEEGEPGTEAYRSVNTVEFVARLLQPGEVATDRPSRVQ